MTNKNNDKTLISFLKENYLAVILGLLIVLSVASYLFRFQSDKVKTSLINGSKQSNGKEMTELDSNDQLTDKTHTVTKGENLWKISEKYYGSGYNMSDLVRANKMSNPNILAIGQKLNIPAKVKPMNPTIGRVSSTQTSLPAITGDSYRVVKGDSLWQIAERAYGDGSFWTKLATINKIKNPKKLYVGVSLKLPKLN